MAIQASEAVESHEKMNTVEKPKRRNTSRDKLRETIRANVEWIARKCREIDLEPRENHLKLPDQRAATDDTCTCDHALRPDRIAPVEPGSNRGGYTVLTTAEQRALESPEEAARITRELLEKARDYIAWPLSRTTTKHEPGGITIIVEPADWTMEDAIDMLLVAKELEARVQEARANRAPGDETVPSTPAPIPRAKARKATRRALGD